MYIARQPIYLKNMNIFGYELLYRHEAESTSFYGSSSTAATAFVLGELFEYGIEKITDGRKAFINFDREFILSDAIELLDSDTMVIEVLETVEADRALLNRLKYLSQKGYKIALDDYCSDLSVGKAVGIADIIKFDIIETPLDTIEEEVRNLLLKRKILLAEKVETRSEFEKAQDMGFKLFQGYFFSRPNLVHTAQQSKKQSYVTYCRLLKKLRDENVTFDELAHTLESDVRLTYRLLRIISKKEPDYAFASIKGALVHMGLVEIERWISVLMMQEITNRRSYENFKLALVRSKFGEFLAANSCLKNDVDEISLMCLFSKLDSILNMPMENALEELSISTDIFQGLVHGKGKYAVVCNLIQAYENGDWETTDELSRELNIKTEIIHEGYVKAIEWALAQTAI